MKHFIITIDFRDSVITLADRLPEIVGETVEEAIDLELDNGIPRIKAVINGTISTWFRYDSGSSLFDSEDIYLNTTEGVLAELLKTDSTLKPSAHFSGTGVGGTIRLPVYKTDSVTMNELTINKPNLIIQPPQGYFARPDAVGFFGNNLIEKFTAVKAIVNTNCAVSGCHVSPTNPGGVNLQGDANIVAHGAQIKEMAVDLGIMPPAPRPQLSDSDKAKITDWIAAGGKISD